MAKVTSATLTGSSGAGRSARLAGSQTTVAMPIAISTGMLMRKTEPHQKWSSSTPPVIGPMAMARPTPPAQMPMALGCS